MGKITGIPSKALTGLIRTYQFCISPFLGPCCRYYPSCSSYAMEAIHSFGCFHGSYLTLKRVLRCHPWGKGGYDPIPEIKSDANKYDY